MRIHFIFAVMTTAAVAAFPGWASAQPATPSVTPSVTPAAAPAATPSVAPSAPPAGYLDQAKRVLDSVPTKVPEDATKTLGDLRAHFAELHKLYAEKASAAGVPIMRQDPDTPSPTWESRFSDVERDLTTLIGGSSDPVTSAATLASANVAPTPAPPASPAPEVASGGTTTPSGGTVTLPGTGPILTPSTGKMPDEFVPDKTHDTGLSDLDPAIRTNLEQFRLQVELFYSAETVAN